MIQDLTLDKLVRLNGSLGKVIEFLKSYPNARQLKSRLVLSENERFVLCYKYQDIEYEIEFSEEGCEVIFEAMPDEGKLTVPNLIRYLESRQLPEAA